MTQTAYVGKRGGGYHPDTHDKSTDPTTRGMFGAPGRLPADYSLEPYIQQVYNQLTTSSCVGWAFAQAIALRCRVVGTPIRLPSPTALYTFARAYERGSPSDELQDRGCRPSDCVRGAGEWGAPPVDGWPFDPETINEEPDFEEIERASEFKFQGFGRIASEGAARLVDIRQAVSSGYPVAVGTQADRAFEDLAKKDVAKAPDPKNLLGGHMMHIVGYRSSDQAFRGVNQWGAGWADGGLFWASAEWVMSEYMTDMYVVQASSAGQRVSMGRTGRR